MIGGDELKSGELVSEIGCAVLKLSEERLTVSSVFDRGSPRLLEVILERGREVPQCGRVRRVIQIATALCGHVEHRTRLGKPMGSGEPPSEDGRAVRTQLTSGVPPAS